MQWWNNFVEWISSDQGWRVITDALIPFVAIIVAGLVAALIARSAIKRLLAKHDREQKAAAIGALVNAARQASVWDSLSPQEQLLSDRAAGDADILVRLLPTRGARVAADWAAHEILEFKRGSATFGFQFDTLLAEFRDRLIDWQRQPGRARKIFQSDISRWEVELTDTEKQLQSQQDAWVAEQHSERFPSKAPVGASDPVGGGDSGGRSSSSGTQAVPAPIAQPTTPARGSSATASPLEPASQRQVPVLPHATATTREVEAPHEYYATPISANSRDGSAPHRPE